MPSRSRLPLLACLTVAALAAGCGDDGDDRPTPLAEMPSDSAPTEEGAGAEAAAAYADWVGALARQDAAAACAHHAPEFTIELRQRAILEDRAELGDPCTGFVALLWEDPAFDGEVVDIAVTQATGEDALLAVDLAGGAQTVRMVYHRAKWRVSDTSPRVEDGDPATGADVGRWVDAWCELDPDMSRDRIIGLMGAPSGEYTVADGGEPQLWWAQDQYDFRVYLDVDGSVLELVGDYDALGAEDRAELGCPELRS